MDAATRAVLNETENLLIAETDRAALAALDEDAALKLETRDRHDPAAPARRTPHSPASRRERARTRAAGARQQGRRDAKRAAAG